MDLPSLPVMQEGRLTPKFTCVTENWYVWKCHVQELGLHLVFLASPQVARPARGPQDPARSSEESLQCKDWAICATAGGGDANVAPPPQQ